MSLPYVPLLFVHKTQPLAPMYRTVLGVKVTILAPIKAYHVLFVNSLRRTYSRQLTFTHSKILQVLNRTAQTSIDSTGRRSISSVMLLFLHCIILTPWRRVLLEKLIAFQLIEKLPAIYGTRRYITAFISARHLSLSSASSNQSKCPHPIS